MKYRLISNDTIKNLIDFLDEIQFDAAKENTTEAHHQVNFCNWAINELLNSYNVITTKDFRKSKNDIKSPKKKSRDDTYWFGNIKFIIDNVQLQTIIGSLEVDYRDDNIVEQGFVFKRLGSGQMCGCGESFTPLGSNKPLGWANTQLPELSS